jgi:site-specific recombinase XerD
MDHLTWEQLKRLLAVAKEHSYRNWLLLVVIFWHGLRVSEALALTPKNVRDGRLRLQRLKGSLRTDQPLIAHKTPILDEKSALQTYADAMPNDARLFDISRQQVDLIVKKYCADAGIRSALAHVHVLKHSLAMAMLAEGVPLPMLQKRLGHKSLASTGQYLRVSDDDASAAVAQALSKKN